MCSSINSLTENKIIIRTATVDDAEGISNLVSQVFAETYDFYADQKISTYESREAVVQAIKNAGSFWVVAADKAPNQKETIVGAARFNSSVDPAYKDNPNQGNDNISRVAVSKPFRGRQITKLMFKYIEDEFKPNEILIRCFNYHDWVVKFYQKMGFVKIGDVAYRSPEKLNEERRRQFEAGTFPLKVIRLIKKIPTSDESKTTGSLKN